MTTALGHGPTPVGALAPLRAAAVADTGAPPRAHAQLATFLDLSAQMFCITDFTGALVWWNAAFERTLGYGAEELLGRPPRRTGPSRRPGDPQGDRGGVGGERGGGSDPGPLPAPGHGEWRWLEWTNRVDFGRQRVYGAARDITDRRRDEIALSESEARLRAIMKYSPSVIFVKDLEGRYLLVNDEFCRGTGVADGRRPWA